MEIKTTKKITLRFNANERMIIHRLIIEQVGSRTIGDILGEEMNFVLGWYKSLFTMITKVCGDYCDLDYDETRVLCDLLSKAYNSESEPEKEAIKAMCDGIEEMRKSWGCY